jgi:hypothetical protein
MTNVPYDKQQNCNLTPLFSQIEVAKKVGKIKTIPPQIGKGVIDPATSRRMTSKKIVFGLVNGLNALGIMMNASD